MENRNTLLKIIGVTLFLLLCPVLDIGGHFINIAEFYLYLMIIINIKHIRKNGMTLSLITYGIIFFLVALLTSLISGNLINNHDIYIIRNCVQFACVILIYNLYLKKLNAFNADFNKCILLLFLVFSIPSMFVFLQKIDFLGFRNMVVNLYKPQFYFLTFDDFKDFRYTSIFKDFFTFAVYSVICNSFFFYMFTKMKLSNIQKIYFISLFILNYSAQFFVARTSLVLIPVGIMIVTFFSSPKNILNSTKKVAIVALFIMIVWPFFMDYFIASQFVNIEWISSGMSFFANSEQASTSLSVLQGWNNTFFSYVIDNPSILFSPHHTYNVSEQSSSLLYSDSFYVQEIYRYGIYGIANYFLLVMLFIKRSMKFGRIIAIITFLFVLLNYKGGNVIFMPKNIYLYGIIFSIAMSYNKKVEISDEEENTISNI